MYSAFQKHISSQLAEIRGAGTYKSERVITTPQGTTIRVADGQPVLNMCANNYLGLAQHPAVAAAAKESIDRWGYGLASVRFICGTQAVHKELEAKLAEFLGTEDTILYSSCFDANGGLFETLLGPEDAIISDELNHASIIDGIRLCKAQRRRYKNNDMADLEAKLKETSGNRFRMIATDGVFSMDGYIANLAAICDLAEKYGALLMVDDSHAVSFMGKTGRGSHEYNSVMGRVDIITGTLGKALGGASGGYTSGRKEIIEYLRQRSRPYLFLEHAGAGHRRRVVESAGVVECLDGIARPAGGEHKIFSRRHGKSWVQHPAGYASDLPGDAGRRGAGGEVCGRHVAQGGLCDRLFVSGRAARQGAHPGADFRGALPPGFGTGH